MLTRRRNAGQSTCILSRFWARIPATVIKTMSRAGCKAQLPWAKRL